MKFTSRIKEFSQLITSLTVVIGVLWGAFKFMNKSNAQGELLQKIQVKQDSVIDSLTSISGKVNGLILTVEGVNDNTVLIGNYVEGVNKALVFHLQHSNEVTKEDFAAIMQIIEELKKKEQPIAQQSGSIK